MAERLRIVPATAADLETVAAILEEASAWLRARGIRQWPVVFDRAPLAEGIALGEVYLGLLDGRAAGTLRLQPADPEIWGVLPADALYVHSLAVRRDFAGQGAGRCLLDWAATQAAAAGKRYLRLDCWAGNAALCAYYEQVGFTPCGRLGSGRWQAALFEKEVVAHWRASR